MKKLTGLIDPPVTVMNTLEEILAWKADVENLPPSVQRDIALAEANMLVSIKQGRDKNTHKDRA